MGNRMDLVHANEKNKLKILIANTGIIFAYWSISKEYNNEFINKYGEKFFEYTKEVLVLKNLINGQENFIEIKEPTNNYYIKFNYANSIYQLKLVRIGKNDNKNYGYEINSNIIKTPNIRILLERYDGKKTKFLNIKNLKTLKNPQSYDKETIERLYEKQIIPSWKEYKRENGYREI